MGKKDFVNYSPDSGNGNGVLNVTADVNTSRTNRSTILDVAGQGVSKSLNVSQSAAAINFTQESIVVFHVQSNTLRPNPRESVLVNKGSYYELTIEATYYLDFGIGTDNIRLMIGVAEDAVTLTETGDITSSIKNKLSFIHKSGTVGNYMVGARAYSQNGTPTQSYLDITCKALLLEAYVAGAMDAVKIRDCYRFNDKPMHIILTNFNIVRP